MPPIKVISLERSAERRHEFRARNSHIPFEFVKAVDGMTLSQEAITRTGLFESGLPYRLGAYGAALSHLELWEEVIRTDQALTIAEDDAIFRHDFIRVHEDLLGSASGWDFVLWGWNMNSILVLHLMPGLRTACCFDFDSLSRNPQPFQADSKFPTLFGLDKAPGIPAYSISPAGARKMKSQCFPLSSFSMDWPALGIVSNWGIDVAASKAYPTMNAFVSFPPLVITKNDQAVTTIQNTPHFDRSFAE